MADIRREDVEKAAQAMFRSEPWSSFWAFDDAVKLARVALEAVGYGSQANPPTIAAPAVASHTAVE